MKRKQQLPAAVAQASCATQSGGGDRTQAQTFLHVLSYSGADGVGLRLQRQFGKLQKGWLGSKSCA